MLDRVQTRTLTLSVMTVLLLFHLAAFACIWHEARPGMLSSAAMIVFLFLNLPILAKHFLRQYNFLFWLFYGCLVLSLLHYLFNREVSVYVSAHKGTLMTVFSYLILPPLFFYPVGNAVAAMTEERWRALLEKVVFVSVGCIVTGILLYVTMIPAYVDYLFNTFQNSRSLLGRMSGYLGNSMLMGVICSTTLPLAFGLKRRFWVRALLMAVCLMGSILTLQRGSWAASAMMLLFLMGHSLRHRTFLKGLFRPKSLAMVGLAIALLGGTLLANFDKLDPVFTFMNHAMLNQNITSSTALFSERQSQWARIEGNLGDYPMGMGIGMLSHVTALQGYRRAIPDGNYLRILGELGPLGLIAFLGMLVGGILLAFRTGLPYVGFALLAYAAQAVGTNVFDFYYASFVFWLLLGFVYARAGRRATASRSMPG